MRWIGATHAHEGDLDAANDCYTASLAVAELSEDTVNRANTLNALGNVCWQAGTLDKANAFYESALKLAEAIADFRLCAMVRQNM